MSKHPSYFKLFITVAFISVTLLASSALGQTGPTPPNKLPDEPKPKDLETEVANLKAENAAVREQLRKMEEQQKAILEQFERLQRRLDGGAIADVQPTPAAPLTQPADATAPSTDSTQPPVAPIQEPKGGHYNDGIIIWETSEDAPVPFQLKFTNTTQVRYLNTLSANDTFTDHLGVVREVHKRNDITVNRSMFVFNGYIFDKRARYNLTVWTSAGAASIVVAGNIGDACSESSLQRRLYSVYSRHEWLGADDPDGPCVLNRAHDVGRFVQVQAFAQSEPPAVAVGAAQHFANAAYGVPTRYREVVLTVSKHSS